MQLDLAVVVAGDDDRILRARWRARSGGARASRGPPRRWTAFVVDRRGCQSHLRSSSSAAAGWCHITRFRGEREARRATTRARAGPPVVLAFGVNGLAPSACVPRPSSRAPGRRPVAGERARRPAWSGFVRRERRVSARRRSCTTAPAGVRSPLPGSPASSPRWSGRSRACTCCARRRSMVAHAAGAPAGGVAGCVGLGPAPDRFWSPSPRSACWERLLGERPLLSLRRRRPVARRRLGQILGFVARRLLSPESVAITFVRPPTPAVRRDDLVGPARADARRARRKAEARVPARDRHPRPGRRARPRPAPRRDARQSAGADPVELPREDGRRHNSPWARRGAQAAAPGRIEQSFLPAAGEALPVAGPAAAARGGRGARSTTRCSCWRAAGNAARRRRRGRRPRPKGCWRTGEVRDLLCTPPGARRAHRAASPQERQSVHLALAAVTDAEVDAGRPAPGTSRRRHLGPTRTSPRSWSGRRARAQARGGARRGGRVPAAFGRAHARPHGTGGPRARRRGAEPATRLRSSADAPAPRRPPRRARGRGREVPRAAVGVGLGVGYLRQRQMTARRSCGDAER